MKRTLRRGGGALLLGALLSVVAMTHEVEAAPILDQSCCATTNLYAYMGDLTRAQTFTVGITGTLMTVDVLLSRFEAAGSVQFDIVAGFGSGTTIAGLGAPLASYTLNWNTAALTATYVNLDFADLTVTAGDLLAIVMRPVVGSPNSSWAGASGNPYSGGEALTTTILGPTFTEFPGSVDFGFRTYVDAAAPIPEPATLTLFGASLGALVIRRYRRRNAAHV